MGVDLNNFRDGFWESSDSRPSNLPAYTLIGLSVFLYYLLNLPYYRAYTQGIVPAGDPFSYTVGFYQLLDRAHEKYWDTIYFGFTQPNWYWLINFLIALFSPLLEKRPDSLCLVNFVMFFFATAGLFRMVCHLGYSRAVSTCFSFLWWLYPSNYGFLTYQSTPVMGLDAMFLNALVTAMAHTVVYVLNPHKITNAMIAAFATRIAVWGRGNSGPVVALTLSVPLMYLAYRLYVSIAQEKTWRPLIGALLFGLLALSMTVWFYWKNWGPLNEYYGNHARFAGQHDWNLQDSMHFIKNVPGFFFWRYHDTTAVITIGMLCHLFALGGFVFLWLPRPQMDPARRAALRLLATASVVIYIPTYVIPLYLWTDPLFTVWNVILMFAPMLLALTLNLISVLGVLADRFQWAVGRKLMLVTAVCAVIYSERLTALQTPSRLDPHLATPQEVEAFAVNLDVLLK